MMSRGFIWFPISDLVLPNIYQNLGDLSINGEGCGGYPQYAWGVTWSPSDSVKN